ncbi:heterokaryon incompatibility protein-domain-containing protein [Apiosordaria backusii]|uniref:Heterokaryon incompatibility protein-domain-containing protein n=1 Tax=Apiosordaria backusii TaxID=314023 RepID=A0AA40ES94_9PEZI|nr:heterokaryon incompatibility protein-domain-containing protein [Apiosordaria backusii]
MVQLLSDGFMKLVSSPEKWNGNHPGWQHHAVWDDLVTAAESGCRPCKVFLEAASCFPPQPYYISFLCQPAKTWNQDGQSNFTGAFHLSIVSQNTIKFFKPDDGSQCDWPVPPLPLNKRDLSLDGKVTIANTWLKTCRESHFDCNSYPEGGDEDTTTLPKRVLEVSPPDGHGELRLYETPKGAKGRYIALSHRWGQTQPLITTKNTLDNWKQTIPWDAVPQAFRDAIIVTRKLGIRYLWIDSLCIVQDDHQDWSEQAPEMCSVYSNALLTISATRCDEGCTDTLFADFQHTVTVLGDPSITVAVRAEGPHVSSSTHYPLLQRAWVFQERLLSRRILHFGFDELNWECMEKAWCECDPSTVYAVLPHLKSSRSRNPTSKSSVNSPTPAHHEMWRRMIYWYTQQQLTFSNDRGPAILGLAKEHMTLTRPKDSVYLSGLWSDSLTGDLAWEVAAVVVVGPPKSVGTAELRLPGPTWSWATVADAICMWPLHWVDSPTVKILDIIPPPSFLAAPTEPSLATDRISSHGCITLSGNVLKGTSANNLSSIPPNVARDRKRFYNAWFEASFNAAAGTLNFASDYPPPSLGDKSNIVPDGETVLWLHLGTNPVEGSNPSNRPLEEIGLVLRCVDERLELYERIGLAGLGKGKWDGQGQEVVVKLV